MRKPRIRYEIESGRYYCYSYGISGCHTNWSMGVGSSFKEAFLDWYIKQFDSNKVMLYEET